MKFNHAKGVEFFHDQMSDKAMHQKVTVKNGLNYPFTVSLSNFTPKYAELITYFETMFQLIPA